MSSGAGRQTLRITGAFTPLVITACFAVTFSRAAAQQSAVTCPRSPPPAPRPIDFARDVKPIFARNCYTCHGPEKQKSDYRLDVKLTALNGGSIGGAIVPGDGAHSPMVHYVAGANEEIRMPP